MEMTIYYRAMPEPPPPSSKRSVDKVEIILTPAEAIHLRNICWSTSWSAYPLARELATRLQNIP